MSLFSLRRTTFSVDPDTHIDNIDQAEGTVLEGTSNWKCKIGITGSLKHVDSFSYVHNY